MKSQVNSFACNHRAYEYLGMASEENEEHKKHKKLPTKNVFFMMAHLETKVRLGDSKRFSNSCRNFDGEELERLRKIFS